jgi:3-oxoacyl-[acyl-carrier protein] reductase
MAMELGISGRVAVVIGASQGLGLACAKTFASENANVVICARNDDNLVEAREEIIKIGKGEVEAVRADIHQEDDRNRIFDHAQKAFGSVDILIVNTPGGVAGFKPAATTTRADWEQAIKCKFMTAVELCQAVLPQMRKKTWGRIVNLNTITALEPLEYFSLSNATRLASLGFFRTLAMEEAVNNVIINSIVVGHTKTDALDKYFTGLAEKQGVTAQDVEGKIIFETPAKKLLIPEEIAALAVFLCSEVASGIVGQTFRVDGGFNRAL